MAGGSNVSSRVTTWAEETDVSCRVETAVRGIGDFDVAGPAKALGDLPTHP